MLPHSHAILETERLRAQAQILRANSVRQRILAAHVFCSVAENELRWEPPARARQSLAKIHHALDEIRTHLSEPHHLALDDAARLRPLLVEVEARAHRLQSALDAPRRSRNPVSRHSR